IAAGGLYRWAFRGGTSAEAYRALVAGLTDWLLGGGVASGERFVPMTTAIPNGLPVQWRWLAGGEPRDVVVALTSAHGLQQDTLRDRWWLFVAAIAAFTAEWAWRRRQALP